VDSRQFACEEPVIAKSKLAKRYSKELRRQLVDGGSTNAGREELVRLRRD
jgi:hypothetical protein